MNVTRAQLGFACLAFTFLSSSVLANDIVIDWNQVLNEVLLKDDTVQNPGMASRSMAMTNLAMYDALNAVNPVYQQCFSYPTTPSLGASAEAAALQAGYRVLSSIYPAQQSYLDARRSEILSELSDAFDVAAGIAYGDTVGQAIVDARNGDGFMEMVPYAPTNQPGHWQPDPLNPDQEAWGPEWGNLDTFVIASTAEYIPPEMPAITSQRYADAFREVKELGAKDSSTRTAEQTAIGLFWAYDRAGMGTPMRMYNRILQTVATDQGNTVEENARLFAMASAAVADAGIAAWDTKFTYDFWRPVTGIRQADSDGNAETIADPTWEPLGAPGGTLADGTVVQDFTPPFPTYVSGHASFGGALFGTLAEFYGTDEISFEVVSDEMPGMVRSYDSFSQAMAENGRSRVYLGIHWDFDDTEARTLGSQIAAYVAANHFQAVPEPSGLSFFAAATIGGLLARRTRAAF